jgi:hypothetical protein
MNWSVSERNGMEIKVVMRLLLHPRELASTVVGLDGSIDRKHLEENSEMTE